MSWRKRHTAWFVGFVSCACVAPGASARPGAVAGDPADAHRAAPQSSDPAAGHPAPAPSAADDRQLAPPPVDTPLPDAQPSQSPAPDTRAPAPRQTAGGPDAGAVEDIVVTAQRREQRLQEVPIAINAIGERALEAAGVAGTATLQVAVPSLVVQRQLGNALPFLRGVGLSAGDIAVESSVGVYLDGVYQPTPSGNFFDFGNVERVEVLKGPQGTLFGRNSTGGIIQIITRTPGDRTEADVQVSYENYDRVRATGFLSGRIAPDLFANVSLVYVNQNDGWGRNLVTGDETYKNRDFGARGKLLWRPGDATDVTLAGDYATSVFRGLSAQVPPGAVNPAGQPYPGRYNTTNDVDDRAANTNQGVSLTIAHDAQAVQLKSISAYRQFDGTFTVDQDLSPLSLLRGDFVQETRMYSQELQVFSPSDATFQWLVGAYFFDYYAAFDPRTLTGAFTGPTQGLALFSRNDVRSYSVFGQGTYPLGDATNLTIGGRYVWDRADYRGSLIGLPDTVLQDTRALRYSYDRPTWRVILDHTLTPGIMAYASYNRGIKAGGFTVGTEPIHQGPYRPERLDAFELGLKTELFDRRVILNTAAFYYDFQDIQFQEISAGIVSIFNGPTARTFGGEVELTARVTPDLTISGNAGYLDSRIGDFPGAPNTVRLPNGRTGAGPADFNARGNAMPNAPGFSGNAGFDYRLPVAGGRVNLAGNLFYTESYFSEPDNRLRVQSYVLLNASLGYTMDSGMRLSVFGANLTNAYYYTQFTGQAGLADLASAAAPRTYGVSLGYSF